MNKEKGLNKIRRDFDERYKEEGLCDAIIDIAIDDAYELGRKSNE